MLQLAGTTKGPGRTPHHLVQGLHRDAQNELLALQILYGQPYPETPPHLCQSIRELATKLADPRRT